ncbi:F0F1 ATP synthase subunit A [Mycoplasma sp. ATU-Cv-508]|uniref:F0F1 ATP synthase subunit A n=1 Tax=Mycoplasma sp. ATU-Cv-508 TaxID=2048001 RepID=UPI000FDDEB4D
MDNLYRDVAGNKLERPAPYIFTLLTFLVFGNLISLVGVPAVSTSYSVTLTLALVSWMGVYVVGIVYKRWRFWLRFLSNPLELIGQFAPLISLSFRLFGNIIGGSIILYLLYYMTGWIWQMIPVVGEINLLGA